MLTGGPFAPMQGFNSWGRKCLSARRAGAPRLVLCGGSIQLLDAMPRWPLQRCAAAVVQLPSVGSGTHARRMFCACLCVCCVSHLRCTYTCLVCERISFRRHTSLLTTRPLHSKNSPSPDSNSCCLVTCRGEGRLGKPQDGMRHVETIEWKAGRPSSIQLAAKRINTDE